MSDNKHNGRGMFGKGYYIALLLCAAAIGISGYLYYRDEMQAEPVLQQSQDQVHGDAPGADRGCGDLPCDGPYGVCPRRGAGDRSL